MVVLALAWLGCGSPDLVELRLYPCEFEGIEPQAVTVEITGFDAEGTMVESFEVEFEGIEVATYADGYATVGYRKHADVVSADFRVGWFESASAGAIASADAIAVYEDLAVPSAGKVLVLGELAAECGDLVADETADTADTGDTDDATDEADTDTASTTDDASTTDETTDDTSSSDDTTTDTDTDDTTDTGDPPGPKPGDACSEIGYQCMAGATAEDAGIPLLCDGMMLEGTGTFDRSCLGNCIDGLAVPVDGCGGIGVNAMCMCQSDPAPACNGNLGCFGNELRLCYQDVVVVGTCPGCVLTDGWYTCDG